MSSTRLVHCDVTVTESVISLVMMSTVMSQVRGTDLWCRECSTVMLQTGKSQSVMPWLFSVMSQKSICDVMKDNVCCDVTTKENCEHLWCYKECQQWCCANLWCHETAVCEQTLRSKLDTDIAVSLISRQQSLIFSDAKIIVIHIVIKDCDFLYDLKAASIAPLTLLFREMRSADSRMVSFLEICSDLSISRPLVNRSLRAMYAAVSLTLVSSVSESPVANSWLGAERGMDVGSKQVIALKLK